MLSLRLDIQPTARSEPCFDTETMAFINQLRFVAMGCRAMRKTDLFEACALLHVTGSKSREAHAEALMRCLREALGKRPKLHAPGTVEVTFDEAWLARLGQASARGDEATMSFLLGSRVAPENRRLIRFLIGRIAECFSLT